MRTPRGVVLWVAAGCAIVLAVLGVGALLQYLAADVEQRPQLIALLGQGAPAVLFGTALPLAALGMGANWLYRR